MPKCDFIEITLRYGCSPVNLLHIFRASFLMNTSRWLLLVLFFLSRAPTRKVLFLIRDSYMLKSCVGFFHSRFRSVLIKVYICVQQEAWTL